jgi:P-type Cu+ transporter
MAIPVAMGLFGLGKKQAKDPVCGMAVDPKTAAGSAEHAGKTYHFCSAGCKQKFSANPAQYAK